MLFFSYIIREITGSSSQPPRNAWMDTLRPRARAVINVMERKVVQTNRMNDTLPMLSRTTLCMVNCRRICSKHVPPGGSVAGHARLWAILEREVTAAARCGRDQRGPSALTNAPICDFAQGRAAK